MLIDALRPGLAELFGAAAIDWARDEAMSGRDVHLEIPPRLLAEIHREETLEETNAPPVLRSLPMADDTIPLGMFTDHGPGAHRSAIGPDDPTPVEKAVLEDAWLWLKRDDLFEYAGVRGGKVRTCLALAKEARHGLVTAGSRSSPQVNIVARIGRSLGLPVRAHVPAGPMGPEVEAARAAGAEIIAHRPGYNNVIIARARADAAERGWTEIPFGMETAEAVRQTGRQVKNVPDAVRRIVVPVGSGMTLAGVLSGLRNAGRQTPVVGVVVGADPSRRLDRYADPDWRERVTLIRSDTRYEKAVAASIDGVTLDPHYEAKCFPWLVDGDLLWIVGIRQTEER
jgi:1-aminocyclopropane-1-carboxylate deaminase/D-cysteine desulfhydrase-like pyridoxal-dependent ACC family enzyme